MVGGQGREEGQWEDRDGRDPWAQQCALVAGEKRGARSDPASYGEEGQHGPEEAHGQHGSCVWITRRNVVRKNVIVDLK